MCGRDEHETRSASAFAENLAAPMPLPRKAYLFLRNLLRRVVFLNDCCGHPGEPGC